ncbi:MAG: MBL fold metallo-hydrolase [Trueperaceae bacterium]|nr:MBL fold metallo-hydrolase [Trueperaceae bacterium]
MRRPGERRITPTERRIAPGVHQLALPSRTLPPFTDTWTTLLVANGRAALVDPGFMDPRDAEVLVDWARRHGARDLDRILLTHTHGDHVEGLPALLELLGPVPVHVHPAEADRVPGDGDVRPLGDGRRLMLGGAVVQAIHTPGHAPGHLAYELSWPTDPGGQTDAGGQTQPAGVVAGDLLTGRGSSWIGLPEGDVAAYLDSLARVRSRAPSWLTVAHGEPIDDPVTALDAARDHRLRREAAIVAALSEPLGTDELATRVYGELDSDPAGHPDGDADDDSDGDLRRSPRSLVRAALLAQLVKLMREMRVVHLGDDAEGPWVRRQGAT